MDETLDILVQSSDHEAKTAYRDQRADVKVCLLTSVACGSVPIFVPGRESFNSLWHDHSDSGRGSQEAVNLDLP